MMRLGLVCLSAVLLCSMAAACRHQAPTSEPVRTLLPAPSAERLLANLTVPNVSFACASSSEPPIERVECTRRDLPGDADSFSVLLIESGPASTALPSCADTADIRPRVLFGPGGASTEIVCLLSGGNRYLKIALLEKIGAAHPATDLGLLELLERYVDELE